MSLVMCGVCNTSIAPGERSTTMPMKGATVTVHEDCYRQTLNKAYRTFCQHCQNARIGPELIPRSFFSIEDGQESLQRAINHIAASDSDPQSAAERVIFLLVAARALYFRPRLPAGLRAEIQKIIDANQARAAAAAVAIPPTPPPAPVAPAPRPVRRYVPEPPHIPQPRPGFDRNAKLPRATALLPQIVSDILAIVGRAVNLVWDPGIGTAATDLMATIYFNPYWFEEKLDAVGYGMVYHETGHIKFSAHLHGIMGKAKQEGGEALMHIVNLILDRHDDELGAAASPGLAMVLRKRLGYLFPRIRTRYPWEDFAYACKKRTQPRFPETRAAMRVLRRLKQSGKWTEEAVLEAAICIRKILGHSPNEESAEEQGFVRFMAAVAKAESGPPLTQVQIDNLDKAIQVMLVGARNNDLKRLQRLLRMQEGSPPPTVAHRKGWVEPEIIREREVDPAAYQAVRQTVAGEVARARALFRSIESPVETVVRFQDEGELDFQNLSRLVTGLGGCFAYTTVDRDLDASIHLAQDLSSSMTGAGEEFARKLGVIFTESILTLRPYVEGHAWGYRTAGRKSYVFDYGPCRVGSALAKAKADGSNADWEALTVISRELRRSTRRRKVIIMIGDDGPSDPEEVNRLAARLLQANIPVIHILVGVVAAPRIYPVQLLFRSFPELVGEFGSVLDKIFRWSL